MKHYKRWIIAGAALTAAVVLLLCVAGVFRVREVTVTGNEFNHTDLTGMRYMGCTAGADIHTRSLSFFLLSSTTVMTVATATSTPPAIQR